MENEQVVKTLQFLDHNLQLLESLMSDVLEEQDSGLTESGELVTESPSSGNKRQRDDKIQDPFNDSDRQKLCNDNSKLLMKAFACHSLIHLYTGKLNQVDSEQLDMSAELQQIKDTMKKASDAAKPKSSNNNSNNTKRINK